MKIPAALIYSPPSRTVKNLCPGNPTDPIRETNAVKPIPHSLFTIHYSLVSLFTLSPLSVSISTPPPVYPSIAGQYRTLRSG
jgi:hypothetical protein